MCASGLVFYWGPVAPARRLISTEILSFKHIESALGTAIHLYIPHTKLIYAHKMAVAR